MTVAGVSCQVQRRSLLVTAIKEMIRSGLMLTVNKFKEGSGPSPEKNNNVIHAEHKGGYWMITEGVRKDG